MDFSDRATALETRERTAAIEAAVSQPVGPGTDECIDCGEVIPAARKLAYPGARRCIDCQTIFEGLG